jgi:hypothetical protein
MNTKKTHFAVAGWKPALPVFWATARVAPALVVHIDLLEIVIDMTL